MLTFNEMGLSPNLMKGIEDLGFENPTPIQEKVIPIFFETENDIVGLAQTGTGKTAAFGLPIIEKIDIQNKRVQALVLSPTRELCIQITKDLQTYSKHINGLEIVAVYGGASIDLQIRALKRGAQIIVATPGRMLDLIKRKAANISNIKNVVLDEADEMLNMGFRDELDHILENSPATKRTLLFSATMPKEVANIAKNYMNNPEKIIIGARNSGAENVSHIYYQVHARNRFLALKRIADINPNIYGIVFCRTRMETKEVADKLIKNGYNADALHGDLSQSQRDQVMKRFRDRTLQMLVATDVAARGIDVEDITHIINYNLPENPEAYIHRSGRTGRAGKSGVSIAIVNYREVCKITQIERYIHKKFTKEPVPSGNEICKKQLFKLIDRMENVEVDEAQIDPFMETVNKKLEWLSKEQIIKHFLSLEFNRFLAYYKNAPDLNEKDDRSRDSRDSRGRGRDGRSRDRDSRGRGRDGRSRRDGDYRNRDNNSSRGGENSRRAQEGYTRFFLNVGKTDGLAPKNIIGMINDYTKNRDINVGAIDLKDKFSFFEVEEKHSSTIIDSFKNNKYNGRSVRVEIAEKDNNNGGDRRKERRRRNY